MPRDALSGLASDVHARLAPGGTLQLAWPHFEDRVEQRALAVEIAELIERGGVLLAEAPTGLGKSLAYLLPAVLAVAGGERRVVVATATRSLQDQLVERDLPMVLSALGLSLRVARLKGKQNYLCPRALELAEGRGGEEDDAFDALRHWAATDPEGDLDRFDAPDAETFRRLRARVAADPDACTLPVCRRGRECFWVRARRQAGESPIVVVNHALLARAAQVDGLLPDYDILIVDEAHRLEGVLLAQLERSVSRNRFEELLRTTGAAGAGRGSGVLGRLRSFSRPTLERPETSGVASEDLDALARRSAECRADVETLFTLVEPPRVREGPYGTRARYRSAAELLGGDLEPLERVHGHCLAFARRLHQWGSVLDTGGASGAALELSAELDQASARWSAVASDLLELCEATSRGSVYWRSAGGRGVELHGAPISAGAYAREQVLARARAVVLTSATLTAGGDFAFTADRLGLGESWGAPYAGTSHRSPFALERQMRTFVLGDAKGDEAAAVSDVVAALAEATGRNQLVLFTAHERLRRARERLMGRLPKGAPLWAQEWDGSVSHVTEQFRTARGGVLLGVQSLWEGVDFPGAELEIVVVAKLPFSVPDDPRVEARGEQLRERALDPFRDDAVPEAVLRFRQGVGRLIRRADDRGVLVVCDPRLRTASYRRPFLEALPTPPIEISDTQELAKAAAQFLNRELQLHE